MTDICYTCSNNTKRNKKPDYYEAATDAPIPKECPKLYYDGPVEQTAGYKCPVCGGYTDPYDMGSSKDNSCIHCGYELNV